MQNERNYVRYKLWIDEENSCFEYLFPYCKKVGVFVGELIDNKVFDIVTGEEIKYSKDPYSGNLAYRKVTYITAVEVANILKNFSKDTILCYKNFMDERKLYFTELYQLHQIKLQKEYEEECSAKSYIMEFIKKNRN